MPGNQETRAEPEAPPRAAPSLLFYFLLALFPLIGVGLLFLFVTTWPLLLVAVLGGMAGGWVIWMLATRRP